MENTERKISTNEAAKLNGVSSKTIIRWAQSGMPHFHFDKKYLFYQSEIDRWMQNNFRVSDNVLSFPKKKAAGVRR